MIATFKEALAAPADMAMASVLRLELSICISLRDSSACSAFNASSVSTDSFLVGLFPFLANVDSVGSFDSALDYYVNNGYAQLK